jgi:hypothetical protein
VKVIGDRVKNHGPSGWPTSARGVPLFFFLIGIAALVLSVPIANDTWYSSVRDGFALKAAKALLGALILDLSFSYKIAVF